MLANCVVVGGKREGAERLAACVVLATTRADVNGTVRRYLDVRKASFLPMDRAVELTGMEYGGITPIGLPRQLAGSGRRTGSRASRRRHRLRRATVQDPAPGHVAGPAAICSGGRRARFVAKNERGTQWPV